MPICLNFTADDGFLLTNEIKRFVTSMGAEFGAKTGSLPTVGEAAPVSERDTNAPETGSAADDKKKGGRKKAPAAEAVIDQPKTHEDQGKFAARDGEASTEPMLTIDEAREKVRGFNTAGHMDEGFKALAEFNAKKLSEVDPAAAKSGEKSALYAKLVARIEELIAAKPVTETEA